MTTTFNSSPQQYDDIKFKELLIYVAQRLLGTPRNGSVKLNKVMYFSDMFAYALLGQSITGVQYVRHPRGPAPEGMKQAQTALELTGDIKVLRFEHFGGRSQTIVLPQRPVDFSVFGHNEKQMVDIVFDALGDMLSDDLSEMSHQLQGWKSARQNEVIPNFTIFLDNRPLKAQEIELGLKVAELLKDDLVGIAPTPA